MWGRGVFDRPMIGSQSLREPVSLDCELHMCSLDFSPFCGTRWLEFGNFLPPCGRFKAGWSYLFTFPKVVSLIKPRQARLGWNSFSCGHISKQNALVYIKMFYFSLGLLGAQGDFSPQFIMWT